MANSKSDISTGFNVDLESATKQEFIDEVEKALVQTNLFDAQSCKNFAKQIIDNGWADIINNTDAAMKNFINEAEEIFHEEAAMSHWSLNMADNSIDKFYSLHANGMSIGAEGRVGVNKHKIGDAKNWQSYQRIRSSYKTGNKWGSVLYYYKDMKYRMYPGRDYSIYAEDEAKFISGFCERAENRFWS